MAAQACEEWSLSTESGVTPWTPLNIAPKQKNTKKRLKGWDTFCKYLYVWHSFLQWQSVFPLQLNYPFKNHWISYMFTILLLLFHIFTYIFKGFFLSVWEVFAPPLILTKLDTLKWLEIIHSKFSKPKQRCLMCGVQTGEQGGCIRNDLHWAGELALRTGACSARRGPASRAL